MDEDARQRLIADAKVQHARDQLRSARGTMPFGVILIALGIAISAAALLLPLGLVGKPMIAGLGLLLIPGGLAVVIRCAVTIARTRKELRESELPSARVVR
jgi:hypothetical protein